MAIIGNQKKFEREFEVIQVQIRSAEVTQQNVSELWRKLITDLLIKSGIAKTNPDGSIDYNDRGYPKINWTNAIFAIYRIIAYLFSMAKIEAKK